MRLFLFFLLGIQLSFSQNLVLQSVNVIPVNTNTVIKGCDVFIKDGKIEKIAPGRSAPYSKDYIVIDCHNKYVMPGLADMHAHFPDDKSPIQLQEYLKLNLAAGVTTIRSMRGEESQLALRDSIRSQKKIAPNIYVSYVLSDKDSLWTKDSVEKIVSAAKQKNYDFIKYLSGISGTNLNYLVESCKKNNMTIAGHAYNRSLIKSIQAGFTSVEHYQPVLSVYMKDSLNLDKTITMMKEKQTAICPTLSFYHVYSFCFSKEELLSRKGMDRVSKKVSDAWMTDYTEALFRTQEQMRDNFETKYKAVYKKQFSDFNRVFKKMADAGVLILLSPDDGLFNVPGFGMAEEMKLYKEAGLTNYQILKTATLNAAVYFKEDKNWGSIEKGKKADLLLLNADPLENIENISKVEGTILNGKFYSQKELLK
jgi:imidazolonepropionase-like amidohydrolase